MKTGKQLLIKVTKKIIIYLFVFYITLILFGVFFADKIVFVPPKVSYSNSTEIIKIAVNDNEKISAVYLHNEDAKFTILYSHGNAGDLGKIGAFLKRLKDHGYSVLAYDYRGYGTSDGTASEQNVYEDENAAFKYLTESLHVPPERVIAFGRSVGSGPATELAFRKKNLGGLILESSFLSIFRILTRFGLVPFDRFANIDKIDKIECPLLVIHGTKDNVVPFWHGEKLFALAKKPKTFLRANSAGHNNILATTPEYWITIDDFVATIGQCQGIK